MIGAKPTIETVAEALKAAVPTLDPAEQRLALRLYRMLLAGKPVNTKDLATSIGADVGLVEAALGRWPGVFRDRKGRIVGFWGLAIRGMPHRLTADEGAITTWCAFDPLIIAPLVTEAARVESADPVSGEPIRLTVTPSGVRDLAPREAVVSMLAPDGPFGHDVVESFCHFVHFFASEDTAEPWVSDHPGTFLLTVDEAFDVATRSWPALFRDALAVSPDAPRGGRRPANPPSSALLGGARAPGHRGGL
jgi:alkylmercury lyase